MLEHIVNSRFRDWGWFCMFSCTYEIPNKKNINYTKESGKKKKKNLK